MGTEGYSPRLLAKIEYAGAKAIVGDGGNWIGPLADLHFPGFVQVLDFLHLLVHLYAAATAAYRGKAKAAWGHRRPKPLTTIRAGSRPWPWNM